MPRACCLLALILALPAAADDKADVPKDLKPFQGTWAVKSAQYDGTLAPADEVRKTGFRLAGNKAGFMLEGRVIDEGTYSADGTKTPAEIDMTGKGGTKSLGIFKFDKDGTRLTICFVKGEAAKRPTEFTSAKGSGQVLMVLEKAKDKD